MKKPKKLVYVNPKQVAFLNATQKRRSFIGGRGSGKSTVYGHKTVLNYNFLPRAKFFLAGLTYNQMLTKTLPSAMDAWAAHGLVEYDKKQGYGHFVLGVKPPSNWIKPYQAPRNYENAITFINGFTIEMLSMDRPDTARGGNYDGGDIDESALMKKDVIAKVLRPMIRGNLYRFSHHLHQTFCDYSSAAWLPSGQWIYETEELAATNPDEYLFIESTAVDNIDVLGQKYLNDLKREMSEIEYAVEVMNKRLTKLPNGFYPSWNPDRQLVANTFRYEYNEEKGLTLPTSNFHSSRLPIETSWDFNAKFTSVTLHQEIGNEFRCIDALWVKEDLEGKNKVIALTDKFCDEYKDHGKREVIIYGDRNGNNKSPGDTQTFYEKIMGQLRLRGWEVTLMPLGLDPDHRLKHFMINEMFAETNPRMPKFRMDQNKHGCKFVAISIQNSPITPDWKKDKSSERLLIDQERATHLSDCIDNITYRKYSHLFGVEQSTAYQVYTI